MPRGFVAPHTILRQAPDTPILVAFSGGADSRTLLDLLVRYSTQAGAKIYAAHVNHGIRGEEADRDEAFCKRVAEGYGITFFSLRADVPKIASEMKKSVELAARDVRYEYFEKLMREHSIPLLAVAHNANDNLETMLFNLARGTSITGLCGIPRVRECAGGTLIRPILDMTREDILAYCEKNSLEYVTDSTNADTEYARNRIRSQAIPALTSVSSAAVTNAKSTSNLLRADAEYLLELADSFLKKNLIDGSLDTKTLCKESKAISSRAVMMAFSRISDVSLEAVHVEAILELAERSVAHSRLCLPDGAYAVIENGKLIFTRKKPAEFEKEEFCVEAHDGENFISQINSEIIIGNTHKEINIYKKSIQLRIDSAKIVGSIFLRSRMEGDKILMGGMRKSVKKLMCDKKTPIDERYRIPIICDAEGILAIPFIGVRDGARPKKDTRQEKITEIKFYLY